MLQSEAGFEQHPLVRWLPDQLFIHPDYRDCHLLYYTGITRTAKSILAEIVSSMFLNSGPHLSLLPEMKAHAMDMSEAILRSNFDSFGRLVGKTWIQNQALDCGTNPPAVAAIIEKIKDYTLGPLLNTCGSSPATQKAENCSKERANGMQIAVSSSLPQYFKISD